MKLDWKESDKNVSERHICNYQEEEEKIIKFIKSEKMRSEKLKRNKLNVSL